MAINKYLFLLLLSTLLYSCFFVKDAPLKLKLVEFQENNLKINGYYIGNLHNESQGLKTVYFLYKNGVILYGRSYRVEKKIDEIESQFKSLSYAEAISRSKVGWGIFNIQNDDIKFEIWSPSSGGALKTNIRQGKIINDSTFIITDYFSNYNNKSFELLDTFHFKKFNSKPDSTNVWIN